MRHPTKEAQAWLQRTLEAKPQQLNDTADAGDVARVINMWLKTQPTTVEEAIGWIETQTARPTIDELVDWAAAKQFQQEQRP